ncbi:hypothetical protein HBI81_129810 [Parastagonospora nodorum]|nr:hypothetical protein HBH51_128630 [Parastagonospora nodorum]KAH3997085.1 hypothetical protein HBI10_146920 [Parastagonospora nodorum]KAH4019955.1 hypothetical protein HBI13_120070 [Parastagonospora nodorum]KAH4118793.1 hypothetical protein HBH47_136860 [Parastagonospora nodorum]KAH4259582.1 hypothetical protein HBI03_136050 [Parastagonospora nodorum]
MLRLRYRKLNFMMAVPKRNNDVPRHMKRNSVSDSCPRNWSNRRKQLGDKAIDVDHET